MKPFGLEAVLKYRTQLEDIARQKLFKLLEKEAETVTSLQNKQQELDGLYADFELNRNTGITVDMIVLYENRIRFVKEELDQLHNLLTGQQNEVKLQRKQLLKASQDKKIMETLKQQQNTAYKKHLNKKEADMLDEIAVLRYNK